MTHGIGFEKKGKVFPFHGNANSEGTPVRLIVMMVTAWLVARTA
jgi:hypothetical protein